LLAIVKNRNLSKWRGDKLALTILIFTVQIWTIQFWQNLWTNLGPNLNYIFIIRCHSLTYVFNYLLHRCRCCLGMTSCR